jgi:RNA polymerase sigma-70 factor (subfamily 1)
MDHAALDAARAIEAFRPYLCVLARMHLDRRLWAKLDPEDIVQTTFQEALENGDRVLPNDYQERKALLRQMLLHNLWDALRRFQQQKRDLALEQPLGDSSSRLMLSLDQSTPSQRAVKNEQLERLAQALLCLTDDQQQAVILHHLHEWKLTDVATQLDRSLHATAGLIHRGLRKLHELLQEGD